MHVPGKTLIVCVLGVLAALPAIAEDIRKPKTEKSTFENTVVGTLPDGWKVGATRQDGPLATWEVIKDPSAPSGESVLAMTKPNHTCRSTYNISWTDRVRFKDGTVSVAFKANSGVIDQGGGPIWRVQNKDNYYICRANPLERNFRVYYVKDGKRQQLASVDTEILAGKWHIIEIEHRGNHIVCQLDGKPFLEVDDNTIPDAGGVGVWTKADAVTSFDDLKVKHRKPVSTRKERD